MPSTRWRKTKEIFQAALDMPAGDRDGFLGDACGQDAALRADVQSLLEYHQQAPEFIEPPSIKSVARAFENAETRSRVGTRLGAYELVRLLDSGGMGHVYLGRRADGQFEKQVAIKIIRSALDSDDLRRRFITEQYALATLDHPNIARLLDGGVTDDGLSYFVMEFIEGRPIDRYCDEHRLSTESRLQLFRQVCAAVHFAHQRLVIHRDLKPANILVTADGTPKLLDFGIAKLLDDSAGDGPGATRELTVPFLTPEYASPEQLRGEPITTASDVYSLGVILYELLSGRPPIVLTSRAPQAIAREICDETPVRPSTAIRRAVDVSGGGSDARGTRSPAEIGHDRGTHPDTLRRRLSGDLDTICMMALRKEPERRYGSVEQFAEDIRRHLAGLPVIARRDTFGYRATKFIRRNRALVFAVSVMLLSLVGGVVGTSIALVYVQRAQARTQLMNEFLNDMLAETDVNNVGRDLTVREMLDRASQRVGTDFQAHPDVEAELRSTIGNAYLSLQLVEAEPHLRRALTLRKQLHGERHPDVARTLLDLANLAYIKGQPRDAELLAQQALDMQAQVSGEITEAYAETLDSLAIFIRMQGDYDRAEPLYKKALALSRHLYGPTDPRTAQTLNNYAVMLKLRGELDRAEALYRECIAIQRNAPETHHSLGTRLSNLASVLLARGDFAAAEPLYREALELQSRLLGPHHPAMAITENNLAMLLLAIARFDEAQTILQTAIDTHTPRLGERHMQIGTLTSNLGALHQQLGRYDKAQALYETALAIRRDALGPEHPDVATSLTSLGSLAIDTGRYEEAARLLNESLAIRRRLFPDGHAVIATTLDQLARLALQRNQPEAALDAAREALALRTRVLHARHPEIAISKMRLGAALCDLGRLEEADPLLREGATDLRDRLGERHPSVASALVERAGWCQATGAIQQARACAAEALAICEMHFAADHPETRRARAMLDDLNAGASDPG